MVRARSLGVYEKRYYHLWLNQLVNRPMKDERPFVPARHRAQIKMPGLGQTMLGCWLVRRIFLPKPGIILHFYSAWFYLGNDPRLKKFPRLSWRPAARRRWGITPWSLAQAAPALEVS
jgi:hypothetical protein